MKKKSVLVVDDNEQNRLLICDHLEMMKVDVEEASSGQECLDKLKEKHYMMVILDVQMPGMHGFEVLKKMRENNDTADIPVIFVSAIYDSDEYILKGIEEGAVDFMSKPINVNILRSKVNNFIKLYEKQIKLDSMLRKLEATNRRLLESEKKFKKITHSANDAIIVHDSNYSIKFWNNASKDIFGYSKYEILSENFIEMIIARRSHENLVEYYNTLVNSPQNIMQNIIRAHGINKLGIEIPIEISLSSFKDSYGETQFTVIIRDISQRIKMEKEALKAKELREANKVMKEFMDNVSHELRTPMNAIMGISNMILKYGSDNLTPKQREGLQIISQSGNRLIALINDILDLSRIDANKTKVSNEEFNLNSFLATIKSLVLSLIENKPIKFFIRKSTNLPEIIYSDQKKLNQILLNLLGNAVKFTKKGKINLFIHIANNELIFEVTDTGIGIKKENLENIFYKFKQADEVDNKEYQGTGLGLNISKKLVELMEGSIKATSEYGIGTTMRFSIPYVKANVKDETEELNIAPPKSLPNETTSFKANEKLAFIIDFNVENIYLYRSILQRNEFKTLSFTDSQKALEKIRVHLPDLIIIKLEMPKIHGSTLLNEISRHEHSNTIPAIVTTSVNNIKLQGISNQISLLEEPIDETTITKILNEHKVEKKSSLIETLVLQEINIDFNFSEEVTETYKLDNIELAKSILSRRIIDKLVFVGMELNKVNFNLINWLNTNKEFIPSKILLITDTRPSDIVLEELYKLPHCKHILMNKLEQEGNLKRVLEKLFPIKK